MDRLFSEVALHQSLGRVIARIGQETFWLQLFLLLHELIPFDNGLALHNPTESVPEVLAEFDADEPVQPSPVPQYLSGLYLLDPFWLACRDGLTDGLYRLSDVAPDLFRQSEYFRKYWRAAIGEDEMQVVLNLSPDAQLLLSLGSSERFGSEHYGCLTVCLPWVISLMRQHWNQMCNRAVGASVSPTRLLRAIAGFGAEALSPRETEIAQLTLRGNSSKAIAGRLSISVETVKVHRRHLYQKLGVASQTELFSRLLGVLEKSDLPLA